jgi:crotonobetainyl-CoA:carnitine CoA-transferase CaiB-like acyl-CoA transferase
MNPTPPAEPDSARAILRGIRVLDMSRVLAGPWAAQLLADFGADVIKLERPGVGDDSRSWEPSFAPPAGGGRGESAYFCSANRGKRSVTVDHGKPEGQALVRSLAQSADVLIENYKVGTLASYGLGYEDLAAINPRLIYVSVTGFGQSGPYRNRPGYDTIIQAMGGMMSITGERDGQPGAGPQRAGLPVIDLMTGVYAALGVMAALRERERTGRGQHIDLALLDVHVSILSYFGMNYLASGQVPVRTGVANPVTYPSGTFDCADGQVVLITGNDAQFRRFTQLLGLPQLADDERFRTSGSRVRHRDTLHGLIAPALRARSSAHWVDALEALGVPCGPINDFAAVMRDPQVRERGLLTRIAHPTLGEIPLLGNPLRMSAAPMCYDDAPPVLGADTDEVLRREAGLSDSQIARLRELGVI